MLPSLTPIATRIVAHAAEALGGVGRRPQIGLGDDLDERHAAAVEVEVRSRGPSPARPSCSDLPASSSMWTRVMPTRRAAPRAVELERPAGRERPIVLGDLVALRQVGIEVVLPREDRVGVDRAAERERRPHGELHGAAVQDRQRAGQPEADGTGAVFGVGAEPRAAAAEDLGGGQQLRVDLEADDGFERWHGSACSQLLGRFRRATGSGSALSAPLAVLGESPCAEHRALAESSTSMSDSASSTALSTAASAPALDLHDAR